MTYKIIDISQPVSSSSAAFPGDTPFSFDMCLKVKDGASVNLTKFTMSPHVGTHTDAPSHVTGDMTAGEVMASDLPLDAFMGPAAVIDLSPHLGPITAGDVEPALQRLGRVPPRLVFKTQQSIRYEQFEDDYSHFTVELVELLAEQKVVLAGIDAPSVDHINAKKLDAHLKLISHRMWWLENLDLTGAEEGHYFMVALPLKFTELEASPVRAVLLSSSDGMISVKQ